MDFLYANLRQCSNEIREIENTGDEEIINQGQKKIIRTIELILQVSHTAKHDGLLGLDMLCDTPIFPDKGAERFREMLLIVVDGIDPDFLNELLCEEFCSRLYTGYDGLQFLLFHKAILRILDGANTKLIEKELMAMVPESIEKAYKDFKETQSIQGMFV